MGRTLRILLIVFLFTVVGVMSSLVVMNLVMRGEEVTVPDLVGKDVISALDMLSKRRLNLKIVGREYTDQFPKDVISSQEPEAQRAVRKGRDVRIMISLGSRQITVPNLIGESYRRGEIVLRQNSLALGRISRVYDRQIEKDLVVAQSPAPRRVSSGGTSVDVLVSLGTPPARYLTPDLIGIPVERVQAALSQYGIRVEVAGSEAYAGVAPGSIIRQQPPFGHLLSNGEMIRVFVSR